MEKFVSETSIHGMEFFESKDNWIRKCGKFVFFVAFCGLGFYFYGIFMKWKIEPVFVEEISLEPTFDYPFPAVTICNPLFSRDQDPNLSEVLKNQRKNLTLDEQKILAANVQACAPQLGSKISKIYPNIESKDTVKILKDKVSNVEDFFAICSFKLIFTKCERLLNYVLTDYGLCFSFNMQSYRQIFNTEKISSDFYSHRSNMIAKFYNLAPLAFETYEVEDDETDKNHWNLEKGYVNDSLELKPLRAVAVNDFIAFPFLNKTDLNNLCPNQGKIFSVFFHLPHETLTPFHSAQYVKVGASTVFALHLKVYETDRKSLRYSPQKRGCYFDDENPLKFFKSYTKAHCEFECLSSETLKQCGCVKFSMPRTNSTPICGLDQTSCYLRVLKDWSEISPTCNCLDSCINVKYTTTKSEILNVKFEKSDSSRYTSTNR